MQIGIGIERCEFYTHLVDVGLPTLLLHMSTIRELSLEPAVVRERKSNPGCAGK